MESREKQIGKYIILNKVLGRGAYAVCKKCVLENDENSFIAVKIIDKNKIQMQNDKEKITRELEHIKREINHLKVLDHDHIVKMHDIAQTSNNLYIFLEFCNGGSLDQYIQKQNGQLSEQESLLIFGEIVNAFKVMQQNKIIHRDMKPQNILIHNSKIKIADFGFSKMMDDTNQAVKQTLLGTPLYLSIEILMGEKYSSKCDVFSVGVILFEMLYGFHPFFQNKKLNGIQGLIQELKLSRLRFPDSPRINPAILQLLTRMLAIHEQDRCTWEDIFSDPYFRMKEEALQQSRQAVNEESCQLKKRMLQSDLYLDQNLVGGLISRTQNSVPSGNVSQMSVEQSPAKEENRNELQDESNQIHEQVLFERNISIFYFNVLRKIWRAQGNLIQITGEALFYKILFTLSRMGLLFLQKLCDYLTSQLDLLNQGNQNVALTQFKNTIQFKQDLQLLNNDKITYNKLQTELKNKCLEIMAQMQSSGQNPHDLQDFQMAIDDNLPKKELKKLFDRGCQQIQGLLLHTLNPEDLETLVLLRYFQILENPYKTFIFKKDEGFNFHKFYEQLEKLPAKELLKQIQNI